MKITRRMAISGTAIVGAAAAGGVYVSIVRTRRTTTPLVRFLETGQKRIVAANGIPDHPIGDFPNRHDPVSLRPQNLNFEMPIQPERSEAPVPLGMWFFGIAMNGIPFDPSGPFWNRDGHSGWQFEVLHPRAAVAFGIDTNRAHTQGRGLYHYHGLPTGLLWNLKKVAPDSPMLLLGFAADGFPIYGPECPGDPLDVKSSTRRLRSSYRIRKGTRNGGPGGRFDGLFVEDYEYSPGSGDLDECNGRYGPTPEFPDGIYHYVLTDEFPQVPRLYRGKPDLSFRHGPPPGISPPVPPELGRYVPDA